MNSIVIHIHTYIHNWSLQLFSQDYWLLHITKADYDRQFFFSTWALQVTLPRSDILRCFNFIISVWKVFACLEIVCLFNFRSTVCTSDSNKITLMFQRVSTNFISDMKTILPRWSCIYIRDSEKVVDLILRL